MNVKVRALGLERLDEARALLRRACAFDDAATVAEEKLFGGWPGGEAGGALAAHGEAEGGPLIGVAAWAGRWLRLLAIDPDARRGGVGTALLDAVVSAAAATGATRLRTGGQAGNYLAPGIDARDTDTLGWFGRRGFVEAARYENLRVPLRANPLVTPERAAELAAGCAARGYDVRRAGPADVAPLMACARSFAPAWAYECERALGHDPPGVHIAVVRAGAGGAGGAGGTVAAFAAHDGNNRGLGWFGPAGTLEDHRGRGLGAALLIPCLLDVAAAGRDHGVIAWIGPREFYEKTAGAQSDRTFVVLQKEPL